MSKATRKSKSKGKSKGDTKERPTAEPEMLYATRVNGEEVLVKRYAFGQAYYLDQNNTKGESYKEQREIFHGKGGTEGRKWK